MARARKNLAQCPEEFAGIRLGILLTALGEWREAVVDGKAAPKVPEIADLTE
jgi:hypothetical protein